MTRQEKQNAAELFGAEGGPCQTRNFELNLRVGLLPFVIE